MSRFQNNMIVAGLTALTVAIWVSLILSFL